MPDVAPLERCLGSTTQIKIVDSMNTFRSFDFSIEEIAGNAGISTKSVRRVMPSLLRYGIIVENRKVGRNTMYRYDTKNPLAEKLNTFITEVATFDAMETGERELTDDNSSRESSPMLMPQNGSKDTKL